MIALSKTEVVVLTKKRIPTEISVQIGDEVAESKPAWSNDQLQVELFSQIRRTVDKAAKGAMSLSRLITKIGSPKSSRRRL